MPDALRPCQPACDLFCRVVDNLGDIGVCWRLARDLAAHHGLPVRLWVDDWAAFARLCPAAAEHRAGYAAGGVEVRPWGVPFPAVTPAALVVEAFACELPEGYVAAMAAQHPRPVWVNLEYLSAEAWVGECHLLASPHPRLPLVKHFFFPGFGPDTGGLLREPGLIAERERLQQPGARAAWLARLGVAAPEEACLVSLFSYAQPALPGLLACWAQGPRPLWLLVPAGRAVAQAAEFFGAESAPVGARLARGALTAVVLPFLAQDDYDRLLWACDVNFVRGEDSFVRAQWAARPFVWHIYRQQGDAHRAKLDAFLARYLADADAACGAAVRGLWQAWNDAGDAARAWPAFAAALPAVAVHTRGWAERLASQPDLASALVNFFQARLK